MEVCSGWLYTYTILEPRPHNDTCTQLGPIKPQPGFSQHQNAYLKIKVKITTSCSTQLENKISIFLCGLTHECSLYMPNYVLCIICYVLLCIIHFQVFILKKWLIFNCQECSVQIKETSTGEFINRLAWQTTFCNLTLTKNKCQPPSRLWPGRFLPEGVIYC